MAHLTSNFLVSLKKSIVKVFIWNKNVDDGLTAIGINNEVFGYYPIDIDGDGQYTKVDLKNSPGEMHIDSEQEFIQKYGGQKITSYDVNMSSRQANSLRNYLLNVAAHPGTYSLWGLNCTSVAIQALVKNGIDIFTDIRYNRFDGDVSINKLSNGFLISPDKFMLILDSGLNSASFSNKTTYNVFKP